MQDLLTGTDYAQSVATTYNASPSKVTLLGGSAGATLVALAAEQMPDLTNVVTLSATFDFPTELAYWESVGGAEQDVHVGNESTALGCTTSGQPLVANCPPGVEDQWSSDQHVIPDSTTRWLLSNETDETDGTPVAQPAMMTAALKNEGDTVTEDIMKGPAHSFSYWKKGVSSHTTRGDPALEGSYAHVDPSSQSAIRSLGLGESELGRSEDLGVPLGVPTTLRVSGSVTVAPLTSKSALPTLPHRARYAITRSDQGHQWCLLGSGGGKAVPPSRISEAGVPVFGASSSR